MGKPKIWAHRILGLTTLVGFWGTVCTGLAWGLYAPLTNVLGWVALYAAWAAFLCAGRAVTARAMGAIIHGTPLWARAT